MFKTLVHLIVYARETKCNDFINSVVDHWRGKGGVKIPVKNRND